jgi:hypothetical protein
MCPPCELSSGFALDCKEGIGGIKAIYLQQLSDFKTGVVVDPSTEEITALPAATIYQFVLPKHTGNFTEEVQSSVENGTIFYTQTVTATFFKLTAPRRKQLELIAKNRLVVFVLDNNDNIWMIGKVDGAEVTAASTSTGTAKGDLNGYTITFTAEEAHKAYLLDAFNAIPFDNFGDIDVEAGTL